MKIRELKNKFSTTTLFIYILEISYNIELYTNTFPFWFKIQVWDSIPLKKSLKSDKRFVLSTSVYCCGTCAHTLPRTKGSFMLWFVLDNLCSSVEIHYNYQKKEECKEGNDRDTDGDGRGGVENVHSLEGWSWYCYGRWYQGAVH